MTEVNFALRCASSMAIATVLATSLSATPALAQDAATDGDKVEEIVVTAQKREQSMQRVPLAISAVTSATLREAGATGIGAVAALVPSLSTVQNNQPLAQSYRIRGLGTDPNIPTFEPSVALFIDGVYMPRSGLGVDDLVDVARVEVLKGPQSTLHGKNATAGVISVVSARPADHFEGSLEGSLSIIEGGRDAAAYRLAGSLTGPIAQGIRARLTAVWYDQAATFLNLTGAQNANALRRYSVRGQLEFDLASNVLLNLTAARSEILDSNATNPDIYLGQPGEPSYNLDKNPALNARFGVSACPDNDPTNRVICTTDPNHSNSKSDMASATLTAGLGGMNLTSITAWSRYKSYLLATDIDQVSLPLVTFHDAQEGENFSQELRLASPSGGTFEWLAGAYYLNSKFARGDHGRTAMFELQPAAALFPLAPGTLPAQVVYGQPGDKGYLDSRASSDYFAVFGQGTYKLTDQFALTAGMRWQTETKNASINNSATFTPNPNLPAGSPLAGINLLTASLVPAATFPAGVPINGPLPRLKNASVSWNVTGNFTPDNATLIYATYSRGNKSGGHNIAFGSAVPALRTFNPEKVDNWELGAKFDLAQKRARIALSLFRSDYKNYQNAGFVGLQYLVNNADKVRVTGLEAEGTFKLSREFTLNLGGAYIDSKFVKYTGGACYFGKAPNSNPTPTGVFTACDLSGQQLPLAPKWRTTAALQYRHPTSFGDIYARTDLNWQSKANVNSASLDPRNVQNAYAMVNARVGVKFDTGFDISVWATNLFDKTIVQQAGVLSLFGTTSGYQNFLGAPRQVGMTARLEF